MIIKLFVKNYALIRELEVEFAPGLNLITGETGAGKSLLLGALDALMGGKLSSDIVRTGADKAVIEGEFNVSTGSDAWKPLSRELEDPGGNLILRREIARSGRSRAFLNDSPVTLKKLSQVGELLVDICGQHENQTLLREEYHLDYLDSFAGLTNLRRDFSSLHSRYHSLSEKLKKLENRKRDMLTRQERVRFETAEIEAAGVDPAEEETLLAEERAMKHSERILEICRRLSDELGNAPGSPLEVIGGLSRELDNILDIEPRLGKAAEDLRSASVSLEETVRGVTAYLKEFDFSPERLEQIRERLGELSLLKRKYGGSIAAILDHLEKLKQEEISFTSLETEIETLLEEIYELKKELAFKALELSQTRIEAAPKLKEAVESILRELGFDYVDFEIRLEHTEGSDFEVGGDRYRLTPAGIDRCQIHITTNKGEPLRPLKDVASGGEISRIMLALKSVISGGDSGQFLVFDEIDIGISGRIARKVGLNLYKTAQSRQALVITHLPQIASLPARHFAVVKSSDDDRTISRLLLLDKTGRVKEIAELLAAGKFEKKGEDYARQLLNADDVE